MALIPRLKPYLDARELLAALTPSGGAIKQFESSFSAKFGCRYGVMFSHGRSALIALLKAWKLDDVEVICPAYTCVVVQHAIVKSGNVPVFVDSEKGSPNMSLSGIESAITEKTRVVLATHLFGFPMNVVTLQKMVAEAEQKFGHKIYVIQDVAHSFGASWKGELVTKYGDAAFFGLNVSKIMTSVYGGMAITNDADTMKRLHDYRSSHMKKAGFAKFLLRLAYLIAIYVAFNKHVYAFTNWLERSKMLDRFTKYYDEGTIDLPSDWDQMPIGLEARVGLVQLSKYDEIIALRRKVSSEYYEHFKQAENVELFPHDSGATYSHFPMIVTNKHDWMELYFQRGIQLGELIEYAVPYMAAYEPYKRGEYPNARRFSEHMINLPNWPEMAGSDIIR